LPFFNPVSRIVTTKPIFQQVGVTDCPFHAHANNIVPEENQQKVGGHDKVKKRTSVHGQSDDTWVVIDPEV